jgi:asparagine synthase (glutamine-hydrolysing)
MTPIRGVEKLLPGHVLIADDDGARVEEYWRYPDAREEALAEDEWAERLLHELEASVRMRLMSDVPLGAMLSGGIDSSVIVALMARNMGEPVKTFSVGFADQGFTDELDDARRVARAFGTDHHELRLSYRESVELEELVWSLDEPLADLSAVGFLALSELAAGHVTVALSGQGADELLGGYPRHRNAAKVERWHRLPKVVRRAGEAGLALGPPRARRIASVLAAPDAATRFAVQQKSMDDDLRRALYRGPLAETAGTAASSAIAAALDGSSGRPLASALRLDAKLGLADDMLHYFDRTSMARSLEVRVPFLDHRFVELSAAIPGHLKVRNGTTKYLLKKVARDLIPAEIIDKPKVGFFHDAIGTWFRTHLTGEARERLAGADARTRELLDGGAVAQLAEAVAAGRAVRRHERLLLSVLMLELWISTYLPRAQSHANDAPLAAAL